jgi:NADPH2:quinone reductase
VNYASHDFVAEVMRLTDGQGADAVLDGVGGDTLLRSLECLRTGGKLVTYGASSGGRSPQIDVFRLWLRNLSLVGVSTRMNGYAAFPAVLELIAAGKLKPVIDRVFPLADAAAAHRHLEERRVFGKAVLSIN